MTSGGSRAFAQPLLVFWPRELDCNNCVLIDFGQRDEKRQLIGFLSRRTDEQAQAQPLASTTATVSCRWPHTERH